MNEPESRRLIVTFDLDYDPKEWGDPDTPIAGPEHLLVNIADFLGIVSDPMRGNEDASYQITNPTVYTMKGFFDDLRESVPE